MGMMAGMPGMMMPPGFDMMSMMGMAGMGTLGLFTRLQ